MPSDQIEMPWILNTAFSEAAQEEARRIAEEVLQQRVGTRIEKIVDIVGISISRGNP